MENALTTAAPASNGVSILPPFEVKPWHMMLAPFMTKLMAPLSTLIVGIMFGSTFDTIVSNEGCGMS